MILRRRKIQVVLFLFRRRILILFFILCALVFCDAVAQSKFKESLTIGASVTGDFIYNFSGGIKTGYTLLGKEELIVDFNTGKAKLWKRGCLHIHGLNTNGEGASENLTGDLQVLSNIEAGNHLGLFELWYKQEIGDFSILAGQHEMNSEFLASKYSHIFVNSSFGIMPSISLNMPVAIFPLAAPGIVVKYGPVNNFIYRMGMYDGNPGTLEDNLYNLNVKISHVEGFFNIAEVEYVRKSVDNEIGNFKLGSYYHSGHFVQYPDTSQAVNGDFGVYALADIALFPRSFHAGHGLGVFLQGGLTDRKINMVHYFMACGLRYHGILEGRFNDQLGIGYTHINISNHYLAYASGALSFESSFEATYLLQLGKYVSIQPTFHYIINPGINKYAGNALVGLLRCGISY